MAANPSSKALSIPDLNSVLNQRVLYRTLKLLWISSIFESTLVIFLWKLIMLMQISRLFELFRISLL